MPINRDLQISLGQKDTSSEANARLPTNFAEVCESNFDPRHVFER